MKKLTKWMLVAGCAVILIKVNLDRKSLIRDLSNKIESLESKIESDSCIIEKLEEQIDSIQKRYHLFENNPGRNFINALNAIIQVESSGNDKAYNAKEDAVGCLQIRRCMVDDVNRILARKGNDKRYTYEDRWNRLKSIEMFNIFCSYYGLGSAEEMARCWNGGPRGINNPATLGYWNKVESELEIYASR